jgi:hypothetical protein
VSPRLDQARIAFSKAVFANLKPRLKGSAWKVAGESVFSRVDDWFVDLQVSVHRNEERTTALLQFKPMAIDPILWDIFDLPDNHRQPMSFRANGAFVCGGLPVMREDLEFPGDTAVDVAQRIARICLDRAASTVKVRAVGSFSDEVARDPNHVERGAHAITRVCALVAEGRFDDAQRASSEFATGKRMSSTNFTWKGRSFHEYALEWLSARTRIH